MFTVCMVTPTPRPYTWSHKSTVSMVTPLPDHAPWITHQSLQGEPPHQILHF